MKTLALPRHTACLPTRRCTLPIRCSSEQPKRARLAEVTAGRLAFGGLLSTSIIGNFTGTSMIQQYSTETPYVWSFVAAVVVSTLITNPGGITDQKASLELQAGRSSMVVVALLAMFDLLFIQS